MPDNPTPRPDSALIARPVSAAAVVSVSTIRRISVSGAILGSGSDALCSDRVVPSKSIRMVLIVPDETLMPASTCAAPRILSDTRGRPRPAVLGASSGETSSISPARISSAVIAVTVAGLTPVA